MGKTIKNLWKHKSKYVWSNTVRGYWVYLTKCRKDGHLITEYFPAIFNGESNESKKWKIIICSRCCLQKSEMESPAVDV